jgi:selenide,water dikinase
MLAAVDGGEAEELVARLRAAGHEAAVIGRVVAGPVGIRVRG